MRITEILEKMIVFSDGNIHDIDHFLRVWSYTKTIGEGEELDNRTQYLLEAAALVHDIACPLCREKYGNTNGKHQEEEGGPLVREFFAGTGLPEEDLEQLVFLVSHHHTLTGIDRADWQILVEADYIANASENGDSPEKIRNFMHKVARTDTGKRLMREVFCLGTGEE